MSPEKKGGYRAWLEQEKAREQEKILTPADKAKAAGAILRLMKETGVNPWKREEMGEIGGIKHIPSFVSRNSEVLSAHNPAIRKFLELTKAKFEKSDSVGLDSAAALLQSKIFTDSAKISFGESNNESIGVDTVTRAENSINQKIAYLEKHKAEMSQMKIAVPEIPQIVKDFLEIVTERVEERIGKKTSHGEVTAAYRFHPKKQLNEMTAEEFKTVLQFWADVNKAIGAFEVEYFAKKQQIPKDAQFIEAQSSLPNQIEDMGRHTLKDYAERWDALLAGYDSFENIDKIVQQIQKSA